MSESSKTPAKLTRKGCSDTYTLAHTDGYLKFQMMKAHLAVAFFIFFKKRKRLGGSSGSVGGEGASLKESPVVVLTPDASSRCESLFPQRVISALLLLMLLLLRRFSMIRKERKRDRERN